MSAHTPHEYTHNHLNQPTRPNPHRDPPPWLGFVAAAAVVVAGCAVLLLALAFLRPLWDLFNGG